MPKLDVEQLVERCRANLKAGKAPLEGLGKAEAKAVMNRYAHFDDRADESGLVVDSQVVLRSLRTPRPFLHMMASTHDNLYGIWGSFWDGTRGGFSCVDSVMAGKITSHLDTNYVPTAPEPQDVRDFWVHESGKAWPMFPVPGHEERGYSKYECRQGLDTYSLSCQRQGLAASLLVHVPVDWPLEVWELSLTNATDRPRDLSWFCRIKVCVDSFPFYYFVPRVVCEGIIEDGGMVFLNHDQNNKHPRQAFFLAEPGFDGYDMMSEVFDDRSPRAVIPGAVARGACFNSAGLQPYAGLVAAAQFNAQLAPGQSKTWRIIYGACTAEAAQRRPYIAKVRQELLTDVGPSRAKLAGRWDEWIRNVAVHTPDAELNRYFNVWSKYQARNQSRFCHALDKIGYRDILQHLLGICDFDAPFVKSQLAQALQYQYPDGRAVRQFEKFKNAGHDLRMYQDSPSWIPDTLVKYVRETGDFDYLNQQVPYLDAQTLQPSATESGTIYDHAVRGLKSIYENAGFHGLCRIGYGDWCDALSRIGGEKGVSIWLSCACVYGCKLMADLAERMGKADDAATFRQVAEDLTGRINQHAWDGQWYIYAINQDGVPIGSHTQAEGSIHLNVNTWAIFSGVAAAAGREEQVWQAIAKLATPLGHALLDPPYTLASRQDVGRIADMQPGHFENGAIYMHGESFYLYALITAGASDRWYEEVHKTMPACLVPDITTGPPHQQSNYAVGPSHAAYGQNPFSNFTGSLAWYRRGIETICGLMADFDGLRVAPQPPKAWKSYRVVKNFRGCTVQAEFRRGRKASIKLNGQDVPALIPASLLPAGSTVKLEVEYT